MQYGKTEGNTQYPVFGIAASDEDLDTIRTTLKKKGIEFEDISEDDDVRFRMIHYQAELCQHPLFVHIEFPERALEPFLDFMERIADPGIPLLLQLHLYRGTRGPRPGGHGV